MVNSELQEATAAAEALPCTEEEKQWIKRALDQVPENQRAQFAAVPQDVSWSVSPLCCLALRDVRSCVRACKCMRRTCVGILV